MEKRKVKKVFPITVAGTFLYRSCSEISIKMILHKVEVMMH